MITVANLETVSLNPGITSPVVELPFPDTAPPIKTTNETADWLDSQGEAMRSAVDYASTVRDQLAVYDSTGQLPAGMRGPIKGQPPTERAVHEWLIRSHRRVSAAERLGYLAA